MIAIGKKYQNLCTVDIQLPKTLDGSLRYRATSICGKVFILTYKEISSAFELYAENFMEEAVLKEEKARN